MTDSMRKFAQESNGTLRERVVVMSKDTHEVLADVKQELRLTEQFTHEATPDSEFTNADMFDKDGNMHKDGSILHLHTHPIDQSFSDGDWKVLARSPIGEMRVVSANNEYVLTKTLAHEDMPWQERTPATMKKKWDEFENESFEHVVKANPDLEGDAFVDAVMEDTNRRMAEHFHVTYEKHTLKK